MQKKEFIEDACIIQGTVYTGGRETEYWSAQYDLIASGYRGPHLHDTTLVLTESASLNAPAESTEEILDRLRGQQWSS